MTTNGALHKANASGELSQHFIALVIILYLADPLSFWIFKVPVAYRKAIAVFKKAVEQSEGSMMSPSFAVRLQNGCGMCFTCAAMGKNEMILNLDNTRKQLFAFINKMWGENTLIDTEVILETLCIIIGKENICEKDFPPLTDFDPVDKDGHVLV